MSNTERNKIPLPQGSDPDIFICSIPGGGMLGMLPIMALDYLEQRLDKPVAHLFPVKDGASTGAIPIVMLSLRDENSPKEPKYSARDCLNFYCIHGPEFFPEIRFRKQKFLLEDAIARIELAVDPARGDEAIIKEIHHTIKELKNKGNDEQQKLITRLEKYATARWISRRYNDKAMEICDLLSNDPRNPLEDAGDVAEFVFIRRKISPLTRAFSHAALAATSLGRLWAKDFLYNPDILKNRFQQKLGDSRLSDLIGSVYVDAHDLNRDRSHIYRTRQKDYFDDRINAPKAVEEGDSFAWDVITATTAHPFGFPPHLGMDNTAYEDMAYGHTPVFCVTDVLHHRAPGMKVKLVFFGTGSKTTKEVDNEALREGHREIGAGFEEKTEHLISHIRSQARQVLKIALKPENIIEFSPRLSPRGKKEELKAVSPNGLNASDENIDNIIKTGLRFIEEDKGRLDTLAKDLAANLYRTGKIDADRYRDLIYNIDNEPLEYTYERPDYSMAPNHTIKKVEKDIKPKEEKPSLWYRLANTFDKVKDRLSSTDEQDNEPSTNEQQEPKKKGRSNGPRP